jgi:hypothetical protein
MNKFLEKHFVAALVMLLPVSAILGVVSAIGIWELVMVQGYGRLMGAM